MSEEQEQPGVTQEEKASQPGKMSRKLVTAMTLLLAVGTAILAYLKDGDFVQGLLAKDEWVSRLIGNLHPVFILIPVGLILMVVIIEILGWLSFGKWKPVTVLALFFAMITSILTCLSGLVLMKLEGSVGPDWNQYMWYGVGATGAIALSFLCKIYGENGNGRGFLYALFLLGGAGALGYGGYTYGQKVHAYTLIPSPDNLESPFENKNTIKRLNASIVQLEVSAEEMREELSEKGQKITELTEAKKKTENNYQNEQKKRAAAEKSVAELKKSLTDARKKTADTQKKLGDAQKKLTDTHKQLTATKKSLGQVQTKAADAQKRAGAAEKQVAETKKAIQMSAQREQKLQQDLKGLTTQIEALKKQYAEVLKKQSESQENSKEKAEEEEKETE